MGRATKTTFEAAVHTATSHSDSEAIVSSGGPNQSPDHKKPPVSHDGTAAAENALETILFAGLSLRSQTYENRSSFFLVLSNTDFNSVAKQKYIYNQVEN